MFKESILMGVGRSLRQLVTLHLKSGIRDIEMLILVSHFIIYSGVPAHGWCCPHLGLIFLVNLNLSEMSS